MSSAATTGADYYNRNQYHVHGGYSKPGGPSYDSSGYSSMGYGGSQVQPDLPCTDSTRHLHLSLSLTKVSV